VTLAVTAAITVGVVALSVLAYLGVSSRLSADLDARLTGEVAAFASALGEEAPGADVIEATRAYLRTRTTAGGPPTVLVVALADGSVLSNSQIELENAEGNEEILAGEAGATGLATVTLDGETWRVAYSTITGDDDVEYGIFEAGARQSAVEAVAREVAWILLASGVVVVIFGAFASAFVARASLKPLRIVAEEASSIDESSLDTRVTSDGRADEIGSVVDALNSMLDRLECAADDQKRFVSDASHELRTPLAIVKGHLELAADERFTPQERAASLATAQAETERMRRIIDDLLMLSRLEAAEEPRLQPLDLGPLAWETAQRARTLGTQDISLEYAGSHWVMGDPDQLERVLLNLISNAVRHTPEDGRISISCDTEGETAYVRIDDTGEGIPEEDLARLFDRFYRAPDQRTDDTGSSGLGLAIAARIVEAHGGTLHAENLSGGGARFEVRLPRIDRPAD
jgi:two-component system OmpR family sensor kinase